MTRLDKLKQLYSEYNRWRNPALPDYARSYPNFFSKSTTTNGLTQCTIAWFRLHGWHAERITSSGRIVDSRKMFTDAAGFTRLVGTKQYIPGTSMKGTADVEAFPGGQILKIEVKNAATRDRMRPEQKRYRSVVMASGCNYIVVTCLDDLPECGINPDREQFWTAMGKLL